ncbi:MAG: DUF4838 domain-containing protein [Clostridia bacterium]|nr:DUF4838 domain-containing protein [Clostridia bacterium]
MKKLLFALLTGVFCAVFAFSAFGAEKEITIVENGSSDFVVGSANGWNKKDINKALITGIIDAIKAKTGVELKESIADIQYKEKEIVIGFLKPTCTGTKKRMADEPGIYSVSVDLVGPQGWAIFTTEKRIVILTPDSEFSTAAREAVYYLLNDCMGYDPSEPAGETVSTLTIPAVNKVKSLYLDCDSLLGVTVEGTDIGEFTVVYPAGASDTVVDLAKNLRRVIFALTGKVVDITDDSAAAAAHEILIGNTNRGTSTAFSTLKTEGGNLFIGGASDEGVVGAFEYFYREYLDIIGKTYMGDGEDIALSGIAFEGDVFRMVNEQPEYTTFLRHTVASLLGTSETPCFSDSATADKLVSAIKASDPVKGSTVYLVNNTASYCSCSACGGKTEAFFSTVNAVAKALSGDGITVATLAYKETLTAPSFALESNVLVYFAAPDLCLGHTIDDESCADNKAVATALKSWAGKARVYVLDFSQDYKYYPSTFPNFGVINSNYKFYTENANGVMYVWCKQAAALEYGELRLALINRIFFEDIAADGFDAAFKAVVSELYGQDAEAMEKYISLFTEKAAEHFTINTKPSEMLPITKTEDGQYDLTLAKEMYAIWKGVFRTKEALSEPLTGMAQVYYGHDYINSDYYLTLHSRVQFTEWLRRNIDAFDMFDTSKELAGVK